MLTIILSTAMSVVDARMGDNNEGMKLALQ